MDIDIDIDIDIDTCQRICVWFSGSIFNIEKQKPDVLFFPHLTVLLLLLLLVLLPPCQLVMAVGIGGPQLPAPDRSGHRGASTASSGSQ